MSAALEQLRRYLRDLLWALQLALQAAPRLIALWMLVLIGQGLLGPGLIVASRAAINGLLDQTRTSDLSLAQLPPQLAAALPAIAAVGAILLFIPILEAFGRYLRGALAEYLRDHVQALIHEKACSLDLAFFESTASYDLLHRARVDALTVPAQLLEKMGNVLQSGLALIGIAAVLLIYSGWFPALLVASAAPGLWVVGKYALAFNRWRLRNTNVERQAQYQDWLLTQREAAPEIRLFGLGNYFRQQFTHLRSHLRQGKLALESQALRAEIAAIAVGWTGLLTGMVWIVWQAATGAARVGDIVMVYQSFQQGQRLLRTLLDSSGGIYKGVLFLASLREFLELRSQLVEPQAPVPVVGPLQGHLRVDNVVFRYPGAGHDSLQGVSLELRPNTITAIVGDNGAGKSTLIKLLCRFFDPTAGAIFLDGVDIRQLSSDDVRNNITALFQEPLKHHAAAADNIALADLSALNHTDRIHAAAAAAGADTFIRSLPDGYATLLGKRFGQADLSTGEWQRIALARSFLRQSRIVLLDEPTSAMDAWAEFDWLQRFRRLVQGRTALLITHRFTTAMLADYIYVMRDGRIIESGTHRQLLALDDYYATAWKAQTTHTQKEPNRVGAI